MNPEDTVRFQLNGPSSEDWKSLLPTNGGLVVLPEVTGNDKEHSITMFHQLHCLRNFHEAFINGTGDGPRRHVQHCLNLLRQEALCQADLTLQPGDFMSRNFTEDRLGATHICRDWAAVYDELEANWIEWRRFQKSSGNGEAFFHTLCVIDTNPRMQSLQQYDDGDASTRLSHRRHHNSCRVHDQGLPLSFLG